MSGGSGSADTSVDQEHQQQQPVANTTTGDAKSKQKSVQFRKVSDGDADASTEDQPSSAKDRRRRISHMSFFSGKEPYTSNFHQTIAVLRNITPTVIIEGHCTVPSVNHSESSSEHKPYRKISHIQPPGTTQYVATTSDSLASIAAQNGCTVTELSKLNKFMSSMIFPGQTIYVPTSGISQQQQVVSSSTDRQPLQPLCQTSANDNPTVVVQPAVKDSLSLQGKSGKRSRRISFGNDFRDPNRLAAEFYQLQEKTKKQRSISTVVRPNLDSLLDEINKTSRDVSRSGKPTKPTKTVVQTDAAECICGQQAVWGRVELTQNRLKFTAEQNRTESTDSKTNPGSVDVIPDVIYQSIKGRLDQLDSVAVYIHIPARNEWKRFEDCDEDTINLLRHATSDELLTNIADKVEKFRTNDGRKVEKNSTEFSSRTDVNVPNTTSDTCSRPPPETAAQIEETSEAEKVSTIASRTNHTSGIAWCVANTIKLATSVPYISNTSTTANKQDGDSETASKTLQQTPRSSEIVDETNDGNDATTEKLVTAVVAGSVQIPHIVVEDSDQKLIGSEESSIEPVEDDVDNTSNSEQNVRLEEIKAAGEQLFAGESQSDGQSTHSGSISTNVNDANNDIDDLAVAPRYFYLYLRFCSTVEVTTFDLQEPPDSPTEFWFRISDEALFEVNDALKSWVPEACITAEYGTVPRHVEFSGQNSILKPRRYQLYVVLREGFDLVAKDQSGLSNPYVKFKLNGKLVHKSRVYHKSQNPRWSETFSVRITSCPPAPKDSRRKRRSSKTMPSLRVVVRDRNLGIFDSYMGEAEIDTEKLETYVPTDIKLTLTDARNRENSSSNMGFLMVQCILHDITDVVEQALQDVNLDTVSELPDELLPTLTENSLILQNRHMKMLTSCLPSRSIGRLWTLCYSTDNHGCSLRTLYRRMAGFEDCPCLVAIKDTNQEVFGSYVTCPLKLEDCFYGSGESFLFSFTPQFRKFAWTQCDDYFVRGESNSLVIGGGGGKLGLWLDGDLSRGRSERCNTFDNDPLSSTVDFTVSCLEAWVFT